jgi:hypothetical protein
VILCRIYGPVGRGEKVSSYRVGACAACWGVSTRLGAHLAVHGVEEVMWYCGWPLNGGSCVYSSDSGLCVCPTNERVSLSAKLAVALEDNLWYKQGV